MRRRLMIGLGNPEPRYFLTRHNAGWRWVEYWAQTHAASPFQSQIKFHARLARLRFPSQEIIIVQPETYMNDSGTAVAALVRFYEVNPTADLLVAYDDLDLPLGRFKFTTHSPRTHNGLFDIKVKLGIDQFPQLRLGVDDRHGDRRQTPADYVLAAFSPEQLAQLDNEVFPAAAKEIETWL